jgi:hypothetical protein
MVVSRFHRCVVNFHFQLSVTHSMCPLLHAGWVRLVGVSKELVQAYGGSYYVLRLLIRSVEAYAAQIRSGAPQTVRISSLLTTS